MSSCPGLPGGAVPSLPGGMTVLVSLSTFHGLVQHPVYTSSAFSLESGHADGSVPSVSVCSQHLSQILAHSRCSNMKELLNECSPCPLPLCSTDSSGKITSRRVYPFSTFVAGTSFARLCVRHWACSKKEGHGLCLQVHKPMGWGLKLEREHAAQLGKKGLL